MPDALLVVLVIIAVIGLLLFGFRQDIMPVIDYWQRATDTWISRFISSIDFAKIHDIGLIFLVLSAVAFLFTVGTVVFLNWRRIRSAYRGGSHG